MSTAEDELACIYNYRRISDRIATGGQPTVEQFQAIQQAGFEVVINLALPSSDNAIPQEGSLVSSFGMTYLHIPVNFQNPAQSDFETFRRMMAALENRSVFIHCAANMRVSAFLYLYRVLEEHVEPSQAELDLHAIWQPDLTWRRFIDEQLTK